MRADGLSPDASWLEVREFLLSEASSFEQVLGLADLGDPIAAEMAFYVPDGDARRLSSIVYGTDLALRRSMAWASAILDPSLAPPEQESARPAPVSVDRLDLETTAAGAGSVELQTLIHGWIEAFSTEHVWLALATFSTLTGINGHSAIRIMRGRLSRADDPDEDRQSQLGEVSELLRTAGEEADRAAGPRGYGSVRVETADGHVVTVVSDRRRLL